MFHEGDIIGPYTLQRTLGRGKFGEVWLAERRASLLTTQVALKLPIGGAADLEAVRQEAQVWLRASGHTSVVPVLEAEIYVGQIVIASEYVAGGSLADWLRTHGGRAPSAEAAVKMTTGILAGLEHLHLNHLIHRDLKPDNVLLQGSTPRLTDFGLTRVLQSGGQSDSISGTPAYMAPESFRGDYSVASDIWATGILLHEMLVGSLPYPQGDFYSLLLAITSDSPVALSNDVPDDLRPILARALTKCPSEQFASAEEMAEALAEATPRRFQNSPQTAPKRQHNLPVQLTSFIGRETEITEIRAVLASARLLTLIGSGGCGKTRLSLSVAAEVRGDFPDGVWFVEMAPLSDPNLAVQAVAEAAGVKEEPSRTLMQSLCESWKSSRLLVILDNCEHLLSACSQLADNLIRLCPNVTVFASSREPMMIAGEQTYRVPSLSLPDSQQYHTPDSLSNCEAVRLFLDRALLARPAFQITDRNAPALAAVCRRLDGIPLALELAAARVRSLSVEEIEARLGERFNLLTGGSRSALPRQQTLRAAVDWSYDLLTIAEQTLLHRLSVFAGGWTLAAAEQICADTEGQDPIENRKLKIENGFVLDLLTLLVDRSLVHFEEREGNGRYNLLETVRQYAAEKLTTTGEAQDVRTRHLAYFLAQAEEFNAKRLTDEAPTLRDALEREHDNCRAALDFCTESSSPEEHLRLVGAMSWFWLNRLYLREGRARLTAALSRPDAQEVTVARGEALNGAARLDYTVNDPQSARTLFEQSAAIFRAVGEKWSLAIVLNNLGCLERQELRWDLAQAFFDESLAVSRTIDDRISMALVLRNIGNLTRMQNDPMRAGPLLEESIALSRETGNLYSLEGALLDLADVAIKLGDYVTARARFREALTLCAASCNDVNLIDILESMAELAVCSHRPQTGVRLFAAAAAMRDRSGMIVAPVFRADYSRRETLLRSSLDKESFAEEWASGFALTTAEAQALAQESLY